MSIMKNTRLAAAILLILALPLFAIVFPGRVQRIIIERGPAEGDLTYIVDEIVFSNAVECAKYCYSRFKGKDDVPEYSNSVDFEFRFEPQKDVAENLSEIFIKHHVYALEMYFVKNGMTNRLERKDGLCSDTNKGRYDPKIQSRSATSGENAPLVQTGQDAVMEAWESDLRKAFEAAEGLTPTAEDENPGAEHREKPSRSQVRTYDN